MRRIERIPMLADKEVNDHDPVNNPSHYKASCIEPIDIIEAYKLDFCEGNIIKYILRWRRKDGLQDLKKAAWYLNRIIDNQSKAD